MNTYLLTTWSRVLLEKLTHFQLVRKFPAFSRKQRFITAFTSAHHLSLSWASSIQSIPPHSTSPKWSLFLRFPQQNPVHASSLLHARYIPSPSHSSRFYHLNNNGWEHRSLSSLLCSFLHLPVASSLLGANILLNTLFSKHPQPTFLPQCEGPSFTHIQNKRQNYSSVDLNL